MTAKTYYNFYMRKFVSVYGCYSSTKFATVKLLTFTGKSMKVKYFDQFY